ncbi:MAG: pyruvate kinase [Deltaproteobacteria bacterium HGW-Deltaproteobacteria-13]|jgi:pyruvate kinase|nr:MAG: pyruvate kinase [Deltaproteobacteria bacterium HGW-Deltaproteobacteria-13]
MNKEFLVKKRKTKLVITMGPALQDDGLLREALKLADAVRLNASHSRPAERTPVLKLIRKISDELGRMIPVFLDLQGPKWRIGLLDEPVLLAKDSIGVLYAVDTPAPKGHPWAAPLPHPELFKGAKVGQIWMLDDGALKLEVTEIRNQQILLKVLVGGLLKARKGVHPIGLDVAFDPLTPQDLEDVRWGVKEGVDLFAQSFVRRASDVEALNLHIRELGGPQTIIAKIEHPQALDNLEEILRVSWGVMVARGDLGVEFGVEKVPALQKQIIMKARRALKPVITATQMLESMIENPQPTRAEASDVANAIWDGTDAVMLSAESAVGKHPIEAINFLDSIAADADAHYKPRIGLLSETLEENLSGRTDVSVAFAACRTAEEIGARLIVVFTEGGGSARLVSRLAADIPVIGATTDIANARRMGLLRGVESLIIPRAKHFSEMLASIHPLLKTIKGLESGDRVVMTLGHPLWTTGTTNMMRVETI